MAKGQIHLDNEHWIKKQNSSNFLETYDPLRSSSLRLKDEKGRFKVEIVNFLKVLKRTVT